MAVPIDLCPSKATRVPLWHGLLTVPLFPTEGLLPHVVGWHGQETVPQPGL